jgi:phosphatidylglycerophosphate synthase
VSAQPAWGEKKRDYWWTVLATDPLAVPLTRGLVNVRWISPNAVSVLAFLLGVAVGPLFALGTRSGLIAGGIMFYVAFLVDCVDGKLARARNQTSALGAALDTIGDAARRASASIGLIIFLYRSDDYGENAFWLAIAYAIAAYFFLELSGVAERKTAHLAKTGREVDEATLEELRGPAEQQGAGRWSSALARHRLLPTPGMPDVQAVVFILGPVTGFVLPGLVVGLVMVSVGMLLNAARRIK